MSKNLRDILAALYPGNPNFWNDKKAMGRQIAAYNLALQMLRDFWDNSPFLHDEVSDFLALESLRSEGKKITGETMAATDRHAHIDAQIRRIHNAGRTPAIVKEICVQYPDVSKKIRLNIEALEPPINITAPEQPAKKRIPAPPTLTTDEIGILRLLISGEAKKQIVIATEMKRTEKTIGNCIKRLRANGLTKPVKGKRSGEGITQKGRDYLHNSTSA